MSRCGETCEPCGDCSWCAQRWRWRDQARERAAQLHAAHKLLADLAACLEDECHAAGADEVKEHPTLRKHAKAAARARRFLAKHTTKTREVKDTP